MGKYMKKAKAGGGEVAVMEVPHQSPLGVRTRARTLALQRLQRSPAVPPPEGSSYLQLRSRRLAKPPAPAPKVPPFAEIPAPSPSPSPRSSHNRAGSVSLSVRSCCSRRASPETDAGVEVSFGDNDLDVEARQRNSRETTPCSLIRDSETIGTPGSTSRRTNSITATRRIQNSISRNIPAAQELEQFFSQAEQLQQRMFENKYTFLSSLCSAINGFLTNLIATYMFFLLESKNAESLSSGIPSGNLKAS